MRCCLSHSKLIDELQCTECYVKVLIKSLSSANDTIQLLSNVHDGSVQIFAFTISISPVCFVVVYCTKAVWHKSNTVNQEMFEVK